MNRPQRSDKVKINQLLMQNGLGTLDDPGLVPQIGFLMGSVIREHEQFRQLLNKCEPAKRRDMYESMKPYIRFEVKPLDVYEAETMNLADRMQVPTIGPNGELKPYRPTEIATERDQRERELASVLITESIAKGALELVCQRCTKEEHFPGTSRHSALDAARKAGWVYDMAANKELCPKCSAHHPV